MRAPSTILAALCAALLGAAAACSIPEGGQGSPSEAYYRLVNVRAAGDLAALWELLHPDIQRDFEVWFISEHLALHEIRTAYPDQDKPAALAALAKGERAELPDAQSLFVHVSREAQAEALGSFDRLAARVRSEDIAEDGATATIRTWGGDTLTFLRGPGGDERWYATLSEQELERLRNARRRAEENLRRVRANLAKLKGP